MSATERENDWVARRRRLLLGSDPPPAAEAARIAERAFDCGYAWWEEEDERAAVDDLEARLRTRLSDPRAIAWLLAYAMYRPLGRLGDRAAFGPPAAGGPLAAVVHRQVAEPERERELAARIPQLTSIRDPVSRTVKSFYDAAPYPRWTTLRRSDACASGPRRILVAGCGTGRHALLVARRWPFARVLAIDLSSRALAYGWRMAEQLGISNVRFGQADLLELPRTNERFDHVEAVGVLHHLDDPRRGYRAVAALAAAGATVRIGVYSRLGRGVVRAAHEHLVARGISDVRSARRAIAALPASHPASVLTGWEDFATASGARDLLLHPVERPYSLPELASALEDSGLTFAGFDPSPDGAPASTDLRAWERFEHAHPRSFATMYRFTAIATGTPPRRPPLNAGCVSARVEPD